MVSARSDHRAPRRTSSVLAASAGAVRARCRRFPLPNRDGRHNSRPSGDHEKEPCPREEHARRQRCDAIPALAWRQFGNGYQGHHETGGSSRQFEAVVPFQNQMVTDFPRRVPSEESSSRCHHLPSRLFQAAHESSKVNRDGDPSVCIVSPVSGNGCRLLPHPGKRHSRSGAHRRS